MLKFIKNEDQRDVANFLLQSFVATAIVALNGLVVFLVASEHLEADSVVVGALLTQLGILVGFCFPNSIGDSKKNDTISRLVEKAPPPTVPKEELTYGPESAQKDTVADFGIGGIDRSTGSFWKSTGTGEPPERAPWERD